MEIKGFNMVDKPSWNGIKTNDFEKGSYNWVIALDYDTIKTSPDYVKKEVDDYIERHDLPKDYIEREMKRRSDVFNRYMQNK